LGSHSSSCITPPPHTHTYTYTYTYICICIMQSLLKLRDIDKEGIDAASFGEVNLETFTTRLSWLGLGLGLGIHLTLTLTLTLTRSSSRPSLPD
jgi:hypothetical protein